MYRKANRKLARYKVAASATPSAMSLVLTAASSQYLSRTWGSGPTDGNKATLNLFVKRASGGSFQTFYDGGIWSGNPGVDEADVRFDIGDTISQVTYNGALLSNFASSGTVTDTTTWHNIHFKYDSTDATATNRVKIYLDGVEVSYGAQSGPTQNTSFRLTDNTIASAIGRAENLGRYLDGKLAYFYFIDGQALTPSSFTTGTGSGTTHPATYSGSYGANGFFLNFSNSNTNDQSGVNNNNWTQNGSPTFSSDVPT
jgi:hypothetical protein